MATNIGHLYYKQYFNGLKLHRNTGKPKLENPINQQLLDLQLTKYAGLIETPYKEPSVSLTTIYPGLLIGSGYIHEVGGKEIENELKLGFFFDHTTGLPVIPGSSVKGLLRSAFKKAGGDYVKELLNDLKITFDKSISALEKAIFENSGSVSIYKRDIFFDAYPVSSGNKNTTFLVNDYITHHENPLKNPNLVQFLKILPNVQFQFNFKLTDNGELSAENKLKLFEKILLDLGIGAKTNVGYGQFKYVPPPIELLSDNITNEHRELLQYDSNNPKNNIFDTIVIRVSDHDYLFELLEDCRLRKTKKTIITKFDKDAKRRIQKGKKGDYKTLEVGDQVKIRLNQPNIPGEINFTVMPIWKD